MLGKNEARCVQELYSKQNQDGSSLKCHKSKIKGLQKKINANPGKLHLL